VLCVDGTPDNGTLPAPALPVDAGARARVRASLGISDSDPVLLLVGAAPHADAVRFTFLNGLLIKSGVRLKGLSTAGTAQPGRGARFQRGREWVNIIRTRRPMLDVLPACDLAVFDGGGPCPTADWPESPGAGEQVIAQAHAGGVPVVAPRWATGDDAYPAEAGEVCRGVNGTLTELARRVATLIMDSVLRDRLSRAVLEHSRRRDTAGAFVAAMVSAWEAAAPEAAHA
jgi:hypothetical protein